MFTPHHIIVLIRQPGIFLGHALGNFEVRIRFRGDWHQLFDHLAFLPNRQQNRDQCQNHRQQQQAHIDTLHIAPAARRAGRHGQQLNRWRTAPQTLRVTCSVAKLRAERKIIGGNNAVNRNGGGAHVVQPRQKYIFRHRNDFDFDPFTRHITRNHLRSKIHLRRCKWCLTIHVEANHVN